MLICLIGELNATYDRVGNDFIIALYNNDGVASAVPIRQYFIKNAQPKNFSPAMANANNMNNIPLDELVFTVDSCRSII